MTERLSLHFHYVHIPSCVIYSCCFWCDFRSYAFIVLNFFQMLLQIIFYFLLIFHTLIFDCLISFLSLHKEPKFSFFKNKEMCVCVQSYLTLCDPVNCSLPGSSVHGILQARMLERVAISFSRGSSWPRDWTCVSWISCIGRQILHTTRATWEASKGEISIWKFLLFPEVILFLNSF